MQVITSTQNSEIKDLAKLKQKEYRDSKKQFLIEGYWLVKLAIESNFPISKLYICKELFHKKFDNESLIKLVINQNVEVQEISTQVFQKLSTIQSSMEGLMALASKEVSDIDDIQVTDNSIFIVAESIEESSNLGGILRLADNVGADGVIVTDIRTDIFSPVVIRSSLGAFFTVNFYIDSSVNFIDWARKQNVLTVATSPNASEYYTDIQYPRPLAVMVGSEYQGLSQVLIDGADRIVKIPMKGKINSMGIIPSLAVMMYML